MTRKPLSSESDISSEKAERIANRRCLSIEDARQTVLQNLQVSCATDPEAVIALNFLAECAALGVLAVEFGYKVTLLKPKELT